MVTKMQKAKPTWSNVKSSLVEMDRHSLLGLVRDLYAASKENQTFLHARFGLGGDILKPYKKTISRWVCPDVMRDQNYSVSRARKAISDYKKAIGHPEGVAELSVFYCEACADFLGACGMDDEGYFDALIRMFGQALKAISQLDPRQQEPLMERLKQVRVSESPSWSYGTGNDMDLLMEQYEFDEA